MQVPQVMVLLFSKTRATATSSCLNLLNRYVKHDTNVCFLHFMSFCWIWHLSIPSTYTFKYLLKGSSSLLDTTKVSTAAKLCTNPPAQRSQTRSMLGWHRIRVIWPTWSMSVWPGIINQNSSACLSGFQRSLLEKSISIATVLWFIIILMYSKSWDGKKALNAKVLKTVASQKWP